MSSDSEQPEAATKPRPDYPPKTPPPPKRPPSPPPPDPPRGGVHTHLLDGLPIPRRAADHPGGRRPTALMKNRPGKSWTLENAPWVPRKAAENAAAQLKAWGYTPPARLPDIAKALVEAVLADGGRRISLHMSEQQHQVLLLAASHLPAVERDEKILLTSIRTLGAVSCGNETTGEGRQVWALLDLVPASA